ncbi:MAG: hypothetical protein HQ581_04355, partial [Planctomycetes bacterium]|nr:hypothetical protein [Planctomycetota bacterium]
DTLVRLEGVHSSAELLRKAGGGRRAVPQPIPKPEKPEDQAPQPKTPAPGGDAPTPGDAPAPGDDPEKPSQPIPIRPGHPIPIRPGQPMPVGGAHAPPPMPAEVKKLFEAKSGFSNYYFNKLHRQRVLEAWTASGDLLGLDGPWTLSGKSEGGAKCTIRLTDADGRLTSPDAEHNWIAGDELGQSLQPRGSGGLLLTLHMWRRLAVLGYGKFGDVYYLGTMPLERGPLAGRDQMVDVLVGTHQAVVCHFLFDPETGHLLGVEMFPDDDVDPCEVYFSDYREVDGRFVPAGMEVRHGDRNYGKFQLDVCTFEKADP